MVRNFRKRLLAGEQLLGTMITLPTPESAEILADAGFDWLLIDCEHGPLETRDVLGVLQAVGHRVACIVRVASGDEVAIKSVLDLGACGILVPQVNSAEQASDVVKFARYPPQGQRGVGLARAHGYGKRFQEYLSTANDEVAVIVQAEHIDGVNCIDAITQVPGIDAVFLGPYDLSASLGKMGDIHAAEVTEAIAKVTSACTAAGVQLGFFGATASAAQPYIDSGYTLVAIGIDTLLLGAAADNVVKEMAGLRTE